MAKNYVLAGAVAGLLFVASSPSFAETVAVSNPSSGEFDDDRFYIAPFGTFVQPGGSRNAAGGWGTGVAFGKILNESFNIEVKGFWQGLNQNAGSAYNSAGQQRNFSGGRTDLTGGTIDLQYYFMRDAFSPYAVFGVGGMNSSSTANVYDSGTSGPTHLSSASVPAFIFEAGLGSTYELADNFLLRADVRYRGSTVPSSVTYNTGSGTATGNTSISVISDMLVNVGFVIPFGDKPDQVAAKPVAAADACASKDSDADGVNDCDDKCAGSAAGTKVDDQGCPIVMELKGVNFHYDSAELTEGAKHVLNGVVDQLVAFPAKKDIEVAGYASFEGNKAAEKHNLQLSQRRSESVAHYLKHKGVTNKLFAKGYGTEYPVADNKTEVGREKNRRVELRWMGD